MVGGDVRRSLAAVADLLARVDDAAAPVPAMGADAGGVVTHVVGCLAFYAHDLVAGPARSPRWTWRAVPTPTWVG
ncbi:MAG: Mycothiol maleylpyruvate isomerase N-terminal protein [Modestobacter sp.]|nr:Mycothiol maleylpyruvate isomerase N-terminal protein [Modestobacter sp.]